MDRRSFYLCAFLIFAVAGAVALSGPVNDPDGLWQLAAGKYILENRSVPRADPFSWTKNGSPWVDHEWLFQVLFYLPYKLGGLKAVYVLGVFAVGSLGAALALFSPPERQIRGYEAALIWLFILAGALLPWMTWRPQMLSYGLFALALGVVRKGSYFWLFPLLLLWANLHGVWPLVLVLFGLKVLADFWDNPLAFKGRWKSYVIILAGLLAVVAMNPYGGEIYTYAWKTVSDKYLMNHVMEWRSPDFHDATYLPFLGGVVLWVFLLYWGKFPQRRFDFLVVLFFLVGSLGALRNIPFFFVAETPYILEVLGTFRLVKGKLGLINLTLALLLVLMLVLRPAGQTLDSLEMPFPKGAVQYLQTHPELAQRVVNHYNYGGLLIYAGIPTFIDGRADIFAKDVFLDHRELNGPRGLAVLAKYQPSAVLWPKEGALNGVLELSGWQKVWEDDGAILWKKGGF